MEVGEEMINAVYESLVTMANVIKEELGDFAYRRVLFITGLRLGKRITEKYKKKSNKNGEELARYIVEKAEVFANPGTFKLEKFGKDEYVISSAKSPEEYLWKEVRGNLEVDKSIFNLLIGFFTGVLREVTGDDTLGGEEAENLITETSPWKFILKSGGIKT